MGAGKITVLEDSYMFTQGGLALIGAGATTLWFILKNWELLHKTIRGFRAYIVAVTELPMRAARIEKELTVNGGSTVKDALVLMKEKVDFLIARQYFNRQRIDFALSVEGLSMFETDAKGNCISVSANYCRLTGRGEIEHLGSNWIHNIAYEDREKVMKEWIDSVNHRRIFDMRYRLISANGIIVVSCKAHPIDDIHGNLAGYFGVIEPVKEQKNELNN